MSLRVLIGIFLLCALRSEAQESPVAPAAVTRPASAQAKVEAEKPLPNLESLVERAKASSDAMLELRKSYTYKQTVVADELDSHGNKKGTHTDEYQVFYVNKTEVVQHMAHDGKPLSDADKRKEQDRVDKRVAEIKAGKQKDHTGITLKVSTLLKLATISAPRREMRTGRPTIAFDYKGNTKADSKDLVEQIMKKLEGTIEIDEQDAQLVHLTGTLQENFHVLGGLAVNVKKGSRFEMEAMRVNDEVWFAKTFTGHVDGRILLLKGFDGDARIAFSDYRKMRTSVTLLPGSQVIGEDGKPIPNLEAEPEIAAPADAPKP